MRFRDKIIKFLENYGLWVLAVWLLLIMIVIKYL